MQRSRKGPPNRFEDHHRSFLIRKSEPTLVLGFEEWANRRLICLPEASLVFVFRLYGQRIDQFLSFILQLRAHMRNLFVDRFQWDVRCQVRRQVVLQNRAENTARIDDEKQNHEYECQRTAKLEPTVVKNEWQGYQSEPQVPTHPRRCLPKSPYRYFFARP